MGLLVAVSNVVFLVVVFLIVKWIAEIILLIIP